MAQLTHVRLEDCFGEEHVVDIRNLPDGVQQSVQKQIEETYGIKQLPFERRKEPDGTIDEEDVREWLIGLPLTDTSPLPALLDTALGWTRRAKCRAVLDKVRDFTPRVVSLLPALLQRLPSSGDDDSVLLRGTILLLRLLRNLCPNSRHNQDCLREAGVPALVIRFLSRMEARTKAMQAAGKNTKLHVESMRMAFQLLANFCTSHPANQQHLWDLLFPSTLLDMMAISVDPQCLGHTFMMLYNCTHQQPALRSEVALSRCHIEAVLAVLSRDKDSAQDDAFEWSVLLIESVLHSGLLPQIFRVIYNESFTVNKLQVTLLKVIDGLTDRLAKTSSDGAAFMPLDSYTFLAQEFIRLMGLFFERRKGFRGQEDIKEQERERYRAEMENVSDVIILLLQIFAAVASVDSSQDAQLKAALVEAGLLDSVIEALGHLSRDSQSGQATLAEWEDPPAMKRDLVRVVANMVHRNASNQDHVRNLGGIPLVLGCCQLDDKNPYIREWGILAVRNLCENNEANQEVIASMQYAGAADNPELAAMGLEVVMENGKFRLRRTGKMETKQ